MDDQELLRLCAEAVGKDPATFDPLRNMADADELYGFLLRCGTITWTKDYVIFEPSPTEPLLPAFTATDDMTQTAKRLRFITECVAFLHKTKPFLCN